MKTKVLVTIMLLLAACQKEQTAPTKPTTLNSITEDAYTIAIGDTVRFDSIMAGEIPDDHSGRVVALYEPFEILKHDTAYERGYAFTILHSPNMTPVSAKLFTDGHRPRNVQIVNDRIMFKYTAALLLPANENLVHKHSIALRVIGDGAPGEWYQVRLDSAVFTRINPKGRRITSHLPQTSQKMIYK